MITRVLYNTSFWFLSADVFSSILLQYPKKRMPCWKKSLWLNMGNNGCDSNKHLEPTKWTQHCIVLWFVWYPILTPLPLLQYVDASKILSTILQITIIKHMLDAFLLRPSIRQQSPRLKHSCTGEATFGSKFPVSCCCCCCCCGFCGVVDTIVTT